MPLPPSLAERLPTLPRMEPPSRLNGAHLWQADRAACSTQPAIGPGERCFTPQRPGTDTCNGDSGTPGLQGATVVALVSRGTDAVIPCGLSYTVATDPAHYSSWITDTIARQHATPARRAAGQVDDNPGGVR